jgi:hypothetical protein
MDFSLFTVDATGCFLERYMVNPLCFSGNDGRTLQMMLPQPFR